MVLTCQLFYKIWNMKNIFMLKNSTTNTCFRGWVQNLNFCLVHKNLGKKAKEINFVRFQKSRLLHWDDGPLSSCYNKCQLKTMLTQANAFKDPRLPLPSY